MQLAANYQRVGNLEPRSINEALRMIAGEDDKVPLLERKREILAGQAKQRMEKGRPKTGEPPVNLPEDAKETRDAVAAEIGTPPPAWITL
jgi:hypothetical protein